MPVVPVALLAKLVVAVPLLAELVPAVPVPAQEAFPCCRRISRSGFLEILFQIQLRSRLRVRRRLSRTPPPMPRTSLSARQLPADREAPRRRNCFPSQQPLRYISRRRRSCRSSTSRSPWKVWGGMTSQSLLVGREVGMLQAEA